MNIVHINSYYITNTLHGELVRKIDQRNCSQNVFVPVEKTNQININFIENLNNTSFYYSKCFNKITRLIWPLKMCQVFYSFVTTFRNKQIDYIHAHSLIANGLIAYLYNIYNKTPYAVTIRNTDFNLFLKKSYFFRILARQILKKADSIMFVSPAYKVTHFKKYFSDSFIKSVENKVHLIPNGINDYWLTNNIKQKTIAKDKIRILFVGRLDKNKNLLSLIKACEIINKFNVVLDIVGDGELYKKLSNKQYKIDVNFAGRITELKILKSYYEKANIFAVTSYTESFGIVYAEAISQGLPVIYSKNQGFDGFFENGEIGYRINPHNIDDIAQNIEKIINNYEKISFNVTQQRSYFSWQKTVDKLLNVYTKTNNCVRNR